MKCSVLYQDAWICVIDKPPGFFVHPSSLDRKAPDCRTELENTIGQRIYNVHRIDRPATGLVLYACTREAAADLAGQFRRRTVRKEYLAIVRGHLRDPLHIQEPLTGYGSQALQASTSIFPLSCSVIREPVGRYREGWFSLVKAEIHTGRPHQVRRHLRRKNHPVIGDTEHGDTAQNRFAETKTGFRRLGLLAYSLQLNHPRDGALIRFCSGVPDWWKAYAEALGLDLAEIVETEPSTIWPDRQPDC